MENTKKTTDKKFPIWGWFYVFFGILFIANAIMVTLANKSFTGVSSETAYQEGIDYNQELARKHIQTEEGWQFAVNFVEGASPFLRVTPSSDMYTLEDMVKGGLIMKAIFYRPTQEGYDVDVELKPSENHGYYQSSIVSLPLKGQWDVIIYADYQGHTYQYKERIMVP